MAELVVVGFHGKRKAAEVLDELQRLSDDWAIELQEGVAVYRRDNGKLRMEASLNPTEKSAAGIGGGLGLLVGAILAAPFTAGTSAAVAAATIGAGAATGATIGAAIGEDAWDWKGRFGISDEFVRNVARMIQPGDSAVFALLSTDDPGKVVRYFAAERGTVLRTTLGTTQSDLLQRSR